MMTAWNKPQSEILTAAAKVYQALSIANPSNTYNSELTVTLDIDGKSYECRCDGVGVIICIINVLGYDANWGTSSVPGHVGAGWYLTDATEPFIKDQNGNISPDWALLDFDSADVQPGDIRASATRSHCDILVANDEAYLGLNANSNVGIKESCIGAVAYISSSESTDLAATSVLDNTEVGKVLRFVKDDTAKEDPGSVDTTNASQSLNSLDIDLDFIEPLSFKYYIKNTTGEDTQVVPGYFPSNAYYPSGELPATDSYGDSWLEFVPNYLARYADSETDWAHAVKDGLVMMYTLDNSDPFTNGRTVFLHDDGTNDYELSRRIVPIVRTQFPVHFRCVITTAAHDTMYGRSSAYFTNQSSTDVNLDLDQFDKALRNASFLLDASGKSPESADNHGYLFLHDEGEYDRSDYISWVEGVND